MKIACLEKCIKGLKLARKKSQKREVQSLWTPAQNIVGISRTRFYQLLTSVIILLSGGFFVSRQLQDNDRRMREELLLLSRSVASAVDLKHVAAFSGSESDVGTPDFQAIRDQLSRIRQASPKCRFCYLLGRRPNGEIFFYADSEPASSDDYSPPGQTYDEATESLERAFANGLEFVEGPVTDRWGTWVSALVPLSDPKTGHVMATFGMDVEAGNWKWLVFHDSAVSLGLILLGEILALVLVARARGEKELKRERHRLASFIDGTGTGTWEWNIQSGEIRINRHWAEFVGYRVDELVPRSIQTWLDLVHPDDLIKSNAILRQHFAGQHDDYYCEYRMKHREGFWVWIRSYGRVVAWTDDGKPLYMIGTHSDITNRKATENVIRDSEMLLRTLIEHLPAGVVIIDIRTHIIEQLNAAASALFGVPPDQIVGTCVFPKRVAAPCAIWARA